ncbi:TetR/AcrR family transcriptional regulator [Rhodalgimonas zhirmunskyi]|uniref:TetR/AcrR family transcriptional regulator n=1 Tax=Rhodalgimonas zhirmunskyi TaxID=2964767 RepID=A0AAJ1U4Q9_9RHOB|nr:TetR/AcrR family transcriptional regulator [Rhodoalgimonas zhirmunskyi]MDQ2093661.1 TetR/AcrR family transcriptional regulator [Rhodoalgimonas zhirmunskyi]
MTKLEKIDKLETKARKRSAKRSRRKDELALAAIDALKQLGYARTSLRDIAEISGVSVGMLHYYFEDKTDLITFCVRKYKAGFVADLEALLTGDIAPDALPRAFADGLCASIRREAETHRLWYDIRAQALFDADFTDVVNEIEDSLLALVSRLFQRLGLSQDGALAGYLALDGGFRYHLQRHLSGDGAAIDAFHRYIMAQFGGLNPQG